MTYPCKVKVGRGKFCSRACYYKFSVGKHHSPETEIKKGQHLSTKTEFKKGEIAKEKHPMWNGGVHLAERGKIGYVRYGDNTYAHRRIMEEHLGRKLAQNEVVHHIDGDGFNNDISNLKLMTASEHARLPRRKELICN